MTQDKSALRKQRAHKLVRQDSGEGFPASVRSAEEDPRVVGHRRTLNLLIAEQEAGRLRKDTAPEWAATMLSGVQEAMMIKALDDESCSYEDALNAVVTLFCEGAAPPH